MERAAKLLSRMWRVISIIPIADSGLGEGGKASKPYVATRKVEELCVGKIRGRGA